MSQRSLETIGVRYTGWAALDRDPLDDRVEFICPQCGSQGSKPARHTRGSYRFSDGFLQDLQGETAVCRKCRRTLRVAPVVLVHDRDEKRRFEAVFSPDLLVSRN
jgi:hypothetical protein